MPTTLDPIRAEDHDRFRRYRDLAAFIDGDQWATVARRSEQRLTLNYARAVTRKTTAYVFPGPVTFRVPPGEGSADAATRAELVLAGAIADGGLAALDVALCTEVVTIGDAAVKVTWDAEASAPRVTAVDPATLVVTTAADDPRQVRSVTQRYALAPDRVRELGWAIPGAPLGERDLSVAERWTSTTWRVEVSGQMVHDGPNPYGWIPYVLLPNDPRPHDPWGRSDLPDLIDVCREINRRMSTVSRILELSGAPIAVLENVDGSEGIAVSPGATWELPEGAKAYLLDLLSGGGISLHREYLEVLFRSLHDLSETPRTAFGDAGRDLSGAALEVEVQPLVQKVNRKRRGWDAFFRARNQRLLDLLERFGGEPLAGVRRTEAVWPSILPSDIDGAVRNATALVAAGIQSRRSAAAALGGIDPEGEIAKVREEATWMESITQ